MKFRIVSHAIVLGTGGCEDHQFTFVAEGEGIPSREVVSARSARFLIRELLGPSALVGMLTAICEAAPAGYQLLVGQTFDE